MPSTMATCEGRIQTWPFLPLPASCARGQARISASTKLRNQDCTRHGKWQHVEEARGPSTRTFLSRLRDCRWVACGLGADPQRALGKNEKARSLPSELWRRTKETRQETGHRRSGLWRRSSRSCSCSAIALLTLKWARRPQFGPPRDDERDMEDGMNGNLKVKVVS